MLTKKQGPKTTTSRRDAAGQYPYTARELAKDAGISSATIARRYLRAAAIPKPKSGWRWKDKAAAKPALDAISRAVAAEGKKRVPNRPAPAK